MKYKNKMMGIITILIILSGLSFFAFGETADSFYDWVNRFLDAEAVFQTMFFFPAIISFFSLLLLFCKEQIFRSWLRFTKYYLPIALLLILTSSSGGGGMFAGGLGTGFDREGMIWFTAGLFFVISVIMIAIKSWKLRGK